jgi:uncharacterized protein YecE (DUF72 family)
VNTENELSHFLNSLSHLHENLGPVFLQLPQSFGPQDADLLFSFISQLPNDYHYAVELRNSEFLSSKEYVKRIVDIGLSIVILDTRPHHQTQPISDGVTTAFLGTTPIIRFVGLEKVKKQPIFSAMGKRM